MLLFHDSTSAILFRLKEGRVLFSIQRCFCTVCILQPRHTCWRCPWLLVDVSTCSQMGCRNSKLGTPTFMTSSFLGLDYLIRSQCW